MTKLNKTLEDNYFTHHISIILSALVLFLKTAVVYIQSRSNFLGIPSSFDGYRLTEEEISSSCDMFEAPDLHTVNQGMETLLLGVL